MPEKRTYDIWLHMSGKPSKVRVQDEALPEQTRRIRQDPSNGWQYDRASEWLRMGAAEPDSPDKPLRITVEHARTRRVQPPSESKPGTVQSGKREWSAATLDSVLEGENWAEIESGLSVWWQEQFGRTDSKRGTAKTWRLRLMNALTWLVQRAERNGHDPYEMFGEDMNLLFELRQLETEDEGWQLLRRLAEKQVRYGRSDPASSRHPVIREMVAIIEQQLDRDLSLRDLAKRAGMHPVHLSRLFKKEQGMSFSDFLLKQRMLAAKRLLESGMKVYETAARTGFKDAGNFSRSFHRYWGAPPIQFKHSPSDR
jgi:AraC-like DNA-binding protein